MNDALWTPDRAGRLNAALDTLEKTLDDLNEGWVALLDGESALFDSPETLAQAHIAARASAQLVQALTALRAAAQAEIAA